MVHSEFLLKNYYDRLPHPIFFPSLPQGYFSDAGIPISHEVMELGNICTKALEMHFSGHMLPASCRCSGSFIFSMPFVLMGLLQKGSVSGAAMIRYEYDELFKEDIDVINKYKDDLQKCNLPFYQDISKELDKGTPFYVFTKKENLPLDITNYIKDWNSLILVSLHLKGLFGKQVIIKTFKKLLEQQEDKTREYFGDIYLTTLSQLFFIYYFIGKDSISFNISRKDKESKAKEILDTSWTMLFEMKSNPQGDISIEKKSALATNATTTDVNTFNKAMHEAFISSNGAMHPVWKAGLYNGFAKEILNCYLIRPNTEPAREIPEIMIRNLGKFIQSIKITGSSKVEIEAYIKDRILYWSEKSNDIDMILRYPRAHEKPIEEEVIEQYAE